MLLYQVPQELPNTLSNLSAANTSLISRPRLALDTHHLDNLASSIVHSQVVNLDNNTYPVEHSRLGKSSSYKDSQPGHFHYEYRPSFSSTSTSDMFNQYPADPPQYDDSPASSPQAAQARPPMSFPQPLSAPHDQPAFAHQNTLSYPSRYGADRPSYQDAPPLDRRMSEPALLSGSHPAAYRIPSVEQSSRYSNPYAASSAYSPQNLHYSRSYTDHSRNDSTGSSVGHSYGGEYRSQWTSDVKQEEGYSETNPVNPSNYSPRPSTASTGVEGTSPLPTYSISAISPTSAVSVSPDLPNMPPQHTTEHSVPGDYQPHPLSPSNSSKTYAFVSLPGTTIRKRPRRRYDEIERLYHCSWPDCAKAYGTLNHLNAHVVMQKHGSRRLPSEFKELRKQWRKAKKEGTFTPPSTHSTQPGPSTPSSSHSPYPPPNPYYSNSPASERRRRMTDPNPPAPLSSYRSPNAYHTNLHTPSNLGGSGWVDEPSSVPERRYALSMSYTSPNSTGVQDAYGNYPAPVPLPSQGEETYRQVPSSTSTIQQGYPANTQPNNQDHYVQGYSYPLPSPPVGHSSSHEHDTPLHNSNVSPSSPSSHHRYNTATSLPPMPSSNIPLNRLPTNSTLLTPLNDYRSTNTVVAVGDSEENRDRATPGSRSTGSEYDEPRRSYDLHSHTQQQHRAYGYDDYENDADSAVGPYSLGRNRLPRDSTLLTPLNLEHMRYGNGKGV